MKSLLWIIILFAVAVGLSIASTLFNGNVYFVVGNTLARLDLMLFVPALILFVVLLYIVVQLMGGLFNIPARLSRFGSARKSRKAGSNLNAAGLAYFEGKYQKAEQEAAKVLKNKEAGESRALALMIAAHAADHMNDEALRARYLDEISALPQANQLSRYLLLAEGALEPPRLPRSFQQPGRRRQNQSSADSPAAAATALCLRPRRCGRSVGQNRRIAKTKSRQSA